MHGGCDPRIFYNVHRPLLSGWRDNPDLPEGLIYEVSSLDLDTSLNRCQPCLMSGSLRGAGPVVRGQRRPVCRHPAAGRWAGGGAQYNNNNNNNNEGGAWRQLGGVPGEDAGLHAASPAGAHSLGHRGAGAEERGRGQQLIMVNSF